MFVSGRFRWWRVAASVMLSVAFLAPANSVAIAEEDATVSFVGSGWGHGVGLSQYGAYGQSKAGYTVDQIIGHYYQGSSIGTMGEEGLAPKENLWVNLEKDRSSLLLIAEKIGYVVPPPLADVTVTRGSDTWVLGVNDKLQIDWNSGDDTCYLEIQDFYGATIATPGWGECKVDITWDGWEEKPSRKIGIDGCFNWDWNETDPVYQNRPCEYARGELHLRSGPGGMDLSVEMDIDDYVLGISEMPYYWGLEERGGLEALKAQALAARSYARELQIYRDAPGNNLCGAWCHVRDTTVDQRYVGWGHVGLGIDEWIEAVDATAGQVISHPAAPNGSVVRAYYSSSSGGATENVHEVWSSFDNPIPYLMSVDDSWALDPATGNPYRSWTATKDADYVASKVGLDTLTGAIVTERNTSGSAKTVLFTGLDNGAATEVEKTAVWVDRNMDLRSIYFDVQYGDIELAPFDDIEGSIHYDDIVYIAELGITKGCNPPSNTSYCPTGTVTRGEMAAFLVRALGLTDDGGQDWFADDDGSVFEADINKLRQAGITSGCNADGTKYCPNSAVSRGEMAAFLVRGFAYTDPGEGDWFTDDDESMFEGDIDRLRQAGVTFGCNPPDNTNFCPNDSVRRDQMASFLARALGGTS